MSYRLTRPIPFGSRNLPYEFRARRAMSGLGVLARGLGEMVHGVQEENCTVYGSDFAASLACVQRNQAAVEASYAANPGSFLGYDANGNPVYAGSSEAAQIYGPGGSGYTNSYTPPPAYTPPAQNYFPRVSFQSSRGGTQLQAGDSWTISITGAPPNVPVTVTGGKNGSTDTNGMGSTDGNGNYSRSGVISSDQAGSWSETWYAGGVNAGSFNFAVVIPQSGSQSSNGQQGQQQQQQGSGQQQAPVMPASSWFDSIPWWGWLAGGGAVLLLARGK